jgi:hypothetical protein
MIPGVLAATAIPCQALNSKSVGPPGGYGTTNLMGRLGQSPLACAKPGVGVEAAIEPAPTVVSQ